MSGKKEIYGDVRFFHGALQLVAAAVHIAPKFEFHGALSRSKGAQNLTIFEWAQGPPIMRNWSTSVDKF